MAEWKISPPRFKTLRRLCICTWLIRTASQKQTQKIICVFLVLLTSSVHCCHCFCLCLSLYIPWALSIQPKIPVISVGTSNETDHFGLVRPEYSGLALKVVHIDWSGHFSRSDRNVPFHLTKLLSPVPLFCILLTGTITKPAVAWIGSVLQECTVSLGTRNFRKFLMKKNGNIVEWKAPSDFAFDLTT